MSKYKETKERLEEIGEEINEEIIKQGKGELLSEWDFLCKKLDRRDMINRIISIVVYYCLMFIMGFVCAVSWIL